MIVQLFAHDFERGPGKVIRNLVRGLSLNGIKVEMNPAPVQGAVKICLQNEPILRTEWLPELLVGPNVFVVPPEIPSEITSNCLKVVVPCQWVKDLYLNWLPNASVAVWPVGVDGQEFQDTALDLKYVDCLLYTKRRKVAEIAIARDLLRKHKQSWIELSYGSYQEADLIQAAKRCRYAFVVDGSESQGMAVLEIAASNLPLFVWDIKEALVESHALAQGVLVPATCVPFWDDAMGLKINEPSNLEIGFNEFLDRHSSKRPRDYVLSSLSLEGQALNLIKIYEDAVRSARSQQMPNSISVSVANSVSVVVPCYNYAHFLPESVGSLFSQTVLPSEIIVVDDASPDDVGSAVRKLRTEYPKIPIKLVCKENGGPNDSRNCGISLAKSDFVCCLDADDVFAPTYLARALEMFSAQPDLEVVFSDVQEFGNSNGEWIPYEYSPDMLASENIIPYCAVLRKKLWSKVGGYYVGLPLGGEDWCYWLSCMKFGMKLGRIREKLFHYRRHGDGFFADSKNDWAKMIAAVKSMQCDLYKTEHVLDMHETLKAPSLLFVARIEKRIKQFPCLGMPYFWLGLQREGEGQLDQAEELYMTSLDKLQNEDWQVLSRLAVINVKRAEVSMAQGMQAEAQNFAIKAKGHFDKVQKVLAAVSLPFNNDFKINTDYMRAVISEGKRHSVS